MRVRVSHTLKKSTRISDVSGLCVFRGVVKFFPLLVSACGIMVSGVFRTYKPKQICVFRRLSSNPGRFERSRKSKELSKFNLELLVFKSSFLFRLTRRGRKMQLRRRNCFIMLTTSVLVPFSFIFFISRPGMFFTLKLNINIFLIHWILIH